MVRQASATYRVLNLDPRPVRRLIYAVNCRVHRSAPLSSMLSGSAGTFRSLASVFLSTPPADRWISRWLVVFTNSKDH